MIGIFGYLLTTSKIAYKIKLILIFVGVLGLITGRTSVLLKTLSLSACRRDSAVGWEQFIVSADLMRAAVFQTQREKGVQN